MADEEVVVSEVDDESEFDTAFNEIAEERDSDPVEEEVVDEVPEETPEPEPVVEVDPYEGMTEEVKAKFLALEGSKDSLQHTIDSDAGRVRAFQLKVNDLETEIKTIRTGATAGPSMSQISDAMKGTDEEWDKFGESYPDVAGAIDRRLEKVGVATETAIAETLKPINEKANVDAHNQRATENKTRVAEVAETFPTWTEAVKTTEFESWLAGQPHGVAQLAESDDTRDASTLIGLYDTHLVADGKPTLRVDPPTGVNEVQLTELEKKRAKQLEDGASPASKKAGINTDGPDTTEFENAFAVFAKKKERQRA
jgi:hypothetical protein